MMVRFGLCGILLVALVSLSANLSIADDLTLGQAISRALENNLELKARREQLKLAEADQMKAHLFFPSNPNLEVERRSDFLAANQGEGSFNLSLSQEFEIAGQRGVKIKRANLLYSLTKAEIEGLEKRIVAGVRLEFFNLLTKGILLKVLNSVIETNSEIEKAASKRLKDGIISQSEYNLLRFDLLRSQAEEEIAEVEYNNSYYELQRLIGLPENQEISIQGELVIDSLGLNLEGLKSLAFANRSDLKAKEFSKQATQQDLRLAFKDRIPNPSLSLSYSIERSVFEGRDITGSSSIVSGITGIRDKDHLVGLKLSWPFPVFDRKKAEIFRSQGNISVLESEIEDLKNEIEKELAQNYQTLKSMEKIVLTFQELLSTSEKTLALLKDAYREGRVNVNDYLNQKDRLLKPQLDYLNAYQLYNRARAGLEKAVGVRWENIK